MPDRSDYIHASFVNGGVVPMICAQGPLEETVNHFWTMVVEQNCGVSLQLAFVIKLWDIKRKKRGISSL
jgi:protein tyrosine phosphatase